MRHRGIAPSSYRLLLKGARRFGESHPALAGVGILAGGQVLAATGVVPGLLHVRPAQASIATAAALAFLSAMLFFVLTVYLPRERRLRALEPHLVHLVENVLLRILFVLTRSTDHRVDQWLVRFGDVSEDTLRNSLAQSSYTSRVSATEDLLTFVGRELREMVSWCERILRYGDVLEPQLVILINDIVENRGNQMWFGSARVPIPIPLETYAPFFWAHLGSYKDLRAYWETRLANNGYVQYRIAQDAIIGLRDYARAVTCAKRALAEGVNVRDSWMLLGVGLAMLGRTGEARAAFRQRDFLVPPGPSRSRAVVERRYSEVPEEIRHTLFDD